MIRSIMFSLWCALAFIVTTTATTIRVPAQQPTIQTGINAAINNDTILVAKGSYNEASVAFNGKKIVLLSEAGRDSTFILGMIVLRQTDILGPVLDGFTVSDSTPLVCFGGTNPTIKNCIFRDGATTGDGGAANVVISSPVFVNCFFTNNHADGEGGAIRAIGASGAPPCNASFTNCDFIANSGGLLCGADIAASGYATLTFNSCFFQSDGESCGGSISSDDARINMQSCTFVDYSYYNIKIQHTTDTSYFKINRSLISVGEGGLVFLINAPMDSVKVSRCIIYGYGPIVPEGTPSPGGYIYADPLFCDTASHDYRISTTSPCAAPYNPWGVLIGKYGTGCTLPWLCGDTDGDGTLSVADVVFIVNFIFGDGMYPSPPTAGDPDCTGDIDIADAVYLVSYIFAHGSAPCSGCPKGRTL
jgi:hypothetical protein